MPSSRVDEEKEDEMKVEGQDHEGHGQDQGAAATDTIASSKETGGQNVPVALKFMRSLEA